MKSALLLSPFAVLLFILPFPGTVALRLACVASTFAIALVSWRRLAPPVLPCKAVLGLWAAIALLSLAYAVDPGYSLGEIKNEIGYTMMAFVAFFVISADAGRMKAMLLALAAGALVLCAGALASRFALGYWDEAGRYGGTGAFANYVIAVGPAIALLGFYFADLRLRRVSLALLGLLLLTGFFCLERIIWPALLLQASVALLFYGKQLGLSRMRIAAALVALLLIAAAVLALTQATRYEDDAAPSAQVHSDVRLAFWPTVAGRIMAHPLAGAGFGRGVMNKAFPDLIPREYPMLWHAHNIVLNYGLEMGIPGMLVLLMVFGALSREYARLWRSDDQGLRMIGACGIVLVLGVLLRNMVNDMFVRDAALLFWALNGMLLGLGRRSLAAGSRKAK